MEEVQGQTKQSKAGKIIKGCLKAIGGITLVSGVVYVGMEVKKEYDATIDENNRLRDFINTHDFYEPQKTIFRSTDMDSEENESTTEKKFDPNNPVYKQSPATMRKLGLNPDGTHRQKGSLVKIDEYDRDGYVVEEWEDIASGLRIYKPTNKKVSDTKEA